MKKFFVIGPRESGPEPTEKIKSTTYTPIQINENVSTTGELYLIFNGMCFVLILQFIHMLYNLTKSVF